MTDTGERRMMRVEEAVEDIRSVLGSARDIVCMAHKDADADSLGSALAFALALREMGLRPHPVVPEPVPYLLDYLPGFEMIETEAPAHDAVFTFDCATVGRFGERRGLVENATVPVVNVDHHVSNTLFGTVNVIEPEASASGQVVYRLLRALDLPIPPAVATNLYAALLTDTGGFRHENTNEASLRLAADLVAAGADPAWVALKSYKSRATSTLRLEALAVAGLKTEAAGRLIWSEVTQAMLAEAGADMQESEGVIDQLQSIDTMELAVLFKESRPGSTKISVRSRGDLDATRVCIPFGGGGHLRAAGAELRVGLEEARAQVLPVARGLLDVG